MVDGHNWNQVHQMLLKKGFKIVQDYTEGVISYIDSRGKKLVINKSNNMSCKFLEMILDHIEISYDDFVQAYEQAYARNP